MFAGVPFSVLLFKVNLHLSLSTKDHIVWHFVWIGPVRLAVTMPPRCRTGGALVDTETGLKQPAKR